MGALEDLQASQAATNVALDVVGTEVTTLTAEAAAISSEVSTLITMSQGAGVPQSVVDQAKAIQVRAEGFAASLKTVSDALAAIPAAPAA